MHAISSYRGSRPTNKLNTPTNTHTNPQTGPITIHCAAASLARSVITKCTGVVLESDSRPHFNDLGSILSDSDLDLDSTLVDSVHSQLSESPLVRGLVLGLGLGSSKVIQTAKKLTSPKVFREVLA